MEEEAEKLMDNNVLLSVTVSREKDEIVYRVDRSSSLTNEELEYYLEEIIHGICTWKPDVCEGTVQNFNGTIRKRKTKKQSKTH
jgi:hypothetical protein